MKERIKQVRKNLGLTMSEFGSQLGVRNSTVSEWEHGKNVPESKRQHLCTVFNVNRTWLDTGKGEMFVRGKTREELDKEAFFRVAASLWSDLPARHKEFVREFIAEVGLND